MSVALWWPGKLSNCHSDREGEEGCFVCCPASMCELVCVRELLVEHVCVIKGHLQDDVSQLSFSRVAVPNVFTVRRHSSTNVDVKHAQIQNAKRPTSIESLFLKWVSGHSPLYSKIRCSVKR